MTATATGAMLALPKSPDLIAFAGTNVPDLIETQAVRRGDHPCLIWAPFEGDHKTWSYQQFRDDVRRLAAGFAAKGVKQGDFVLLHFDNCPEIMLCWFALGYLGAVAVTTNARSAPAEMTYFADHCGAVGAVTSPQFAQMLSEKCDGLGWIIVTDHDAGKPASGPDGVKFSPFDSLYGDGDQLPAMRPAALDPMGVQYTSGTTSRPKGVIWTHANTLWGARQCATQQGLVDTDVHLTTLPMFHTNAQAYSVLSSLWAGGSIVLQPRFSASRFWPVSVHYGCTWASMVPFCAKALLGQPIPNDHRYRWWGNGINNAPWDDHYKIPTLGWWGMTETIAPGIVGSTTLPNRPVSMGRPAQGYDILVVDDNGAAVAPGETGELWVKGIRGVSLFLEYLNNPDATNNSYTDDGWFITGDRVTLHEDGYLSFADRDKDMLKVGGENVAASEIERVIMSVPGVNEVAVVARKDSMLDEVPVAFVLPSDGSDGDHMRASALGDACMRACEQNLADFKIPREVRIVSELPRSTLEKIAKAELRGLLDAEDQDIAHS